VARAKKANGNGNGASARAAREQRELTCKLTQDELLARGDEMANCELSIDKLKAERRGLNGQIADLSEQRGKLAKAIEDEEELRMVDCEWAEDLKQNCRVLKRLDTKQVVDTQPLTAADRQEVMFDEDDEHTRPATPRARGKAATATRHAHA
jgi:hypothetical protein